jgi:hypothetical protein
VKEEEAVIDPADVGEWGEALKTRYRGGRLFFMDAQGVPTFLEAFKCSLPLTLLLIDASILC